MNIRLFTLSTMAAALAACSSVPASNPQLDQVRMRYQAAQSDPALAQNAPEEWTRARVALGRAEKAQTAGEAVVEVTHLSYLAHQQITIAQDAAASRASQATIDGTAAEADRMRLALRTQEADATQRALQASQADSARKSADLAQAGRNAQDDQARLARRDAQLDSLAQQLKDLNARKTERGIVVTLGDMLFDTGQSRLQADGARSMVQLAEFMKRNPQRQAVIDGYTDSVGSETFNQDLSDRRAQSVQTALVGLGVEAARLRTAGHGESDPVASNDTAQGRQSNRRVEIVFAPEAGDLLGK
jgi:outer membrane protein OmpA-like peptidoglycan-associated protein